jgi:hypothetical protein
MMRDSPDTALLWRCERILELPDYVSTACVRCSVCRHLCEDTPCLQKSQEIKVAAPAGEQRSLDLTGCSLQGFFMIDMLSTVPWDIVLTNEALGLVQLFKVSKVIKLLRIIRVLKLVRVLRLLKVCFE